MSTKCDNLIRTHLAESARVKTATGLSCAKAIGQAVELLVETFRGGGKLLLCGNGGSAADCQHIAAEFTSILRQDYPRPGLPAIALTTDTSYLTARGNDFGFDGIYARLVECYGRRGDMLLGISTSGNSANICAAVATGKAAGLRVVVLTGEGGGRLAPLADIAICVPSRRVQHIQETHIAIGHILCQATEECLFPRDSQP